MTEEHKLIQALASGDRAAFRELVEVHKERIYYHALDMVGNVSDAEDISQEVFLRAFRSVKTFRQDARLSSWLYRITYNTCIDHIRRKSLAPVPLENDLLKEGLRDGFRTGESEQGLDPAVLAERKLLSSRIEKALGNVSAREKAVFLMRHREGLQIGEIAEVLDISGGSVKSYLFRVIKKLQKELATDPPDQEVSNE